MHGKQLFTQPDISYHGECPICFLPLPIDESKSTMMSCCSKYICNGIMMMMMMMMMMNGEEYTL